MSPVIRNTRIPGYPRYNRGCAYPVLIVILIPGTRTVAGSLLESPFTATQRQGEPRSDAVFVPHETYAGKGTRSVCNGTPNSAAKGPIQGTSRNLNPGIRNSC
eukprot:1644924-Rhodomonas_salina.3